MKASRLELDQPLDGGAEVGLGGDLRLLRREHRQRQRVLVTRLDLLHQRAHRRGRLLLLQPREHVGARRLQRGRELVLGADPADGVLDPRVLERHHVRVHRVRQAVEGDQRQRGVRGAVAAEPGEPAALHLQRQDALDALHRARLRLRQQRAAVRVQRPERPRLLQRPGEGEVGDGGGDELLQAAVRVHQQVAHAGERGVDRQRLEDQLRRLDLRAAGQLQRQLPATPRPGGQQLLGRRGAHRDLAPRGDRLRAAGQPEGDRPRAGRVGAQRDGEDPLALGLEIHPRLRGLHRQRALRGDLRSQAGHALAPGAVRHPQRALGLVALAEELRHETTTFTGRGWRTRRVPSPKRPEASAATAVTVQSVWLDGRLNETCARPSSSVVTAGFQ